MKAMRTIVLILTLAGLSSTAYSQSRFTIGTGLGTHYTGIGVNFAQHTNSSFRYVSIGCLSVASTSGSDSDTAHRGNCGLGIGYLTNHLFESHKPALGFGFTVTNNETDTFRLDGISRKTGIQYRASVSMNYFFGGINSSGFLAGVSAHIDSSDHETAPGLGLSIGYQW